MKLAFKALKPQKFTFAGGHIYSMVKSQSQSGWGSGGVSCKVTVQSESVLSPTAKKATPPPYSVGGGVDNDSLCTTASTLSIQGDFCKICHCGADPAQVFPPTNAIFFSSFFTR